MPSWRLVLVLCVLLAVPTAVAPGGPLAGPSYLAGLVLIVAALWCGTARLSRTARRPWRLFALAATCWLLGDAVQRLLTAVGHPPGTPGLPDLFWLASYPLLIAALSSIIHARGVAVGLVREIRLDVIAVTGAASVAAWHLLVLPTLEGDGSATDLLIHVMYPLGDLALFALAITFAMTPGRRGAAGALVIACIGLTLPVDLFQAVFPNVLGERVDALLLTLNGLLGAAALHPDRRRLTERRPSRAPQAMHRWRVLMLGISLCTVSVVSAARGDGARYVVPSVLASVLVSVAVVVRFYRVVRERELAEATLTFQAHHDQLTGAANRSLLMDELARSVRGGNDSPLVVIFIDLDGFKHVNDSLGHSAGDEVLRVVTQRLTALVRPTDTVARMGGDEFVVLCRRMSGEHAEAVAHRMREAVSRPIEIGPNRTSVGASIGVLTSVGPEPSRVDSLSAADELLRQADCAMYEAKRRGGGVRTVDPPKLSGVLAGRG